MLTYTVKNKPVAVRKLKSASAPVVNILPINSKLFVNRIEEGWLRLHNNFYVFETENLSLDVMDDETVEQITSKVRKHGASTEMDFKVALQLFAGTTGVTSPPYGTVTLPTYPMNTPQGSNGSGSSTTTEANQSSTDKSENTSENPNADAQKSAKALNEKYAERPCVLDKGAYVFATDGNGNVKHDSAGNPIRWTYNEFMAAYPDSKLFENAGTCMVASIDANGIARVQETNGAIYLVDASHLNVKTNPNDSNTDGVSGDEWERVALDSSIYTQRATEELLKIVNEAAGRDLKDIVDHIIGINYVNRNIITRIHGYPYQFLPTVDNRYYAEDSMKLNALGRKFAEKIVARAPIFTIRAGVPQFMKGYDGVDKASVLAKVAGLGGVFSSNLKDLADILESDGKYYSFRPATHEYFVAINPVLRYLAVLLNIGDVEVPAFASVSSEDEMKSNNPSKKYQKLADMNWEYMVDHPFAGAYEGAVYFYINSDAQVSESFNTVTRQSEIAGKVNSISDRASEIQFLLGGAMGAVGASGLTSGLGKEGESLLNSFKNAGLEGENSLGMGNSTGAGIFNSLIKNLSTMVAGSKMIFPEIWADSQFSRSYNVTIKLLSPDCDKVSIFLNIFVPLVHLLGFVLPRSTASNAYASPFLVQCWYKSMFHIDMGIITACDIVKGETGAWTEDGLPTQVTVQLQIKDLYSVLSQASGVHGNHILSNPAQMDYMANLCGVNIGASDIMRTIVLWKTMFYNGMVDDVISMPTNVLRSVSRSFFNLMP